MFQGYINKLLGVFLIVLSTNVIAASTNNNFIEGKDYTKLPEQVRKKQDVLQLIATDPDKVQVIFFFSYGCHACEMVDPSFEKWVAAQKSKKVVIYRYPVSFNAQWQMLAKLYYVMDALDPKHNLNGKIFNAVHKQGLRLWLDPVMKNFFVQNGYSEKDFDQAYNSFSLNRQVNRANELSKAFGIIETPEIVINGPNASYLLNVVQAGNNVDRFFKVVDYVLQRELKNLGAAQ